MVHWCGHIAFQKFCKRTYLHQPVLLLDVGRSAPSLGLALQGTLIITNAQGRWFITDTGACLPLSNGRAWPIALIVCSVTDTIWPPGKCFPHLLLCLGCKGHLNLKVCGLCHCWHQKQTLLRNMGTKWTAEGLRLLKMHVSQENEYWSGTQKEKKADKRKSKKSSKKWSVCILKNDPVEVSNRLPAHLPPVHQRDTTFFVQ